MHDLDEAIKAFHGRLADMEQRLDDLERVSFDLKIRSVSNGYIIEYGEDTLVFSEPETLEDTGVCEAALDALYFIAYQFFGDSRMGHKHTKERVIIEKQKARRDD